MNTLSTRLSRVSPWARGMALASLAAGAWALSTGMSQAHASDVYWSIGVGGPGVRISASNAPAPVARPPVNVYPAAVYPAAVYPAPVYPANVYPARPVVVATAPQYVVTQPVVVMQPPVVVAPPRVVYRPHRHHYYRY